MPNGSTHIRLEDARPIKIKCLSSAEELGASESVQWKVKFGDEMNGSEMTFCFTVNATATAKEDIVLVVTGT